jgi:hypothetical protein
MLSPELEEKLRKARLVLDAAAVENIIPLCQQYLMVLAEYRAQLYRLPDTLELNPKSSASSSRAEIDSAGKAVRAAIEHTTQERNRTEMLLRSFTALSGYEAVTTINSVKYQGRDTWELKAGGVGCIDNPGKRMSVQEAVETACLLRREAYIAKTDTRPALAIGDI